VHFELSKGKLISSDGLIRSFIEQKRANAPSLDATALGSDDENNTTSVLTADEQEQRKLVTLMQICAQQQPVHVLAHMLDINNERRTVLNDRHSVRYIDGKCTY